MNTPSQEDLLGYVLGALDAQEQRDLQRLIDGNPELEEQLLHLKNAMAPLDCLDQGGPRPGLARRTCEAVASWQKDLAQRDPDTHLIIPAADAESFNIASYNDPGRIDSLLAAANRATEGGSFAEIQELDEQGLNDETNVAGNLAKSFESSVSGAFAAGEGDLKTCGIGANVGSSHASSDTLAKPRMRRSVERVLHPRSWSMTDMLAGVAMLAVLAGIMFPAISYSRFNSRVLACQDNLRQVGHALMTYSSLNDGRFVEIPASGNLAASGCFGPILKDSGLLEDDSLLACAGLVAEPDFGPVHIPTKAEVLNAQNEEQLAHFRRTMAGHFGYSLGYRDGDGYVGPRNMGRSNVVLLSDRPSLDLEGRRSGNHGGKGQNCLFEDGHIEFVAGHTYGGDALFENDYGVVAPGSNAYDNVIAPSHLSPSLGL